jgi:hypothetical protein
MFDSCVALTEQELALIGSYTRFKIAQRDEQAAIDAAQGALDQAKALAPKQTQAEVAAGLPGTVIAAVSNAAGSAAANAGKGFWSAVDLPGLLLMAGAGFLAYAYLTKR